MVTVLHRIIMFATETKFNSDCEEEEVREREREKKKPNPQKKIGQEYIDSAHYIFTKENLHQLIQQKETKENRKRPAFLL